METTETRLPKRILVPTDFSPSATSAFHVALDLARRAGAPVYLLHVLDHVEGDVYSPLRYTPETAALHEGPEQAVYDLLCREIEGMDTGGVRVEPVRRHGAAVAPVVLQTAEEARADLIVMGTHGRRGIKRFLLGSVAEEVVRRAPCAVLTVQEGHREHPVRRLLAPVDFSPQARVVLRQARALAECYGAPHVDVLHVIEPIPIIYEYMQDVREKAQEHLAALVAEEGLNGATVRVEEGHAAATILDVARDTHPDLIVMATRGASGLEHFLIGSVTERVVRAAPCPVFSARAVPVPEAETA